MTLKPNESFPLAEAVTADPLLLADSRIDFATAALRHVAAHPEASKGLNAQYRQARKMMGSGSMTGIGHTRIARTSCRMESSKSRYRAFC